jgi:hypothetical protein
MCHYLTQAFLIFIQQVAEKRFGTLRRAPFDSAQDRQGERMKD